MKTITHSANETIKIARQFAKKLKGGEVIGLVGDLGAGKTVFVKGLALGLGIKEKITSPTFVILKKYDISKSNHSITKSLNHLIHVSHPFFTSRKKESAFFSDSGG